jgi:GNAT superfamily N-acetyltransferase
MSYSRPRPLTPDDDVSGFTSGQPSLDDYLRLRALANHVRGASRCFVSTDGDRIVGYYALAAASIYRRDAPSRVRRNMPEPVPVILLSRLAVAVRDQGRGLGASLLQDAVLRSAAAADLVSVRALLVHALDVDARGFYLHHGFVASPTDPLHLLLPMSEARAALAG